MKTEETVAQTETEKRQEQAVGGFKAILGALNCMALDEEGLGKELAKVLLNEHRTIQQTAMRVIRSMIENYAKDKYEDLRNEGAKRWARGVANVAVWMPLI